LAVVFVLIVAVVVIGVMPLGSALAQQANPSRALPRVVANGVTFNVTVTFTAPANHFNSIVVTDLAPAGWNVTVNATWCTPASTSVKVTGNKAEIVWGASFNQGTLFTAVYKVTVPVDAEVGFYTFAGSLQYYLGSGGPYVETVAGASQVILPPELDVIRYINKTLKSPNMLHPGDTFEVFVNWTAPLNNFSAIALTDVAPAGFQVEANKTWCSPTANETKATGNKVEIAWYGPYAKGTKFTAKYKVTVSNGAAPGSYYFPYNNCSSSWLNYTFSEYGAYTSCTMGDSEVAVTVPGDIVGETRDVNANKLSDVIVTLYEDASGIKSDASTPNYTITVNATGDYWLRGSKNGYITLDTKWVANSTVHPGTPGWNPTYPQFINFTTLELLAPGYVFEFEGDYGLVPTTCTLSYAMKSVNLWLFWPTDHPEWGLSGWKAGESIHSWQFSS